MARTCLAGAVAALLVAASPWAAEAQTTTTGGSGASGASSRPRVFTGGASATAMQFFPDRNSGFTIPDAARVRFVSGDSATSQSGGPAATASIVDPGGGTTKGPAQICGLAGGPVSDNLPQLAFIFDVCNNAHWPFSASADDLNPDSATVGSTDVGQPTAIVYGQGGSAHARVDESTFGASTEANLSGLRLNPLPGSNNSTGLPLPPGLPVGGNGTATGTGTNAPVDATIFRVGSLSATTTNAFDGTTLVVHAESHISGVSLLGGLITIDSIAAIAESRSADGAAPTATSSVDVQGVKVLGQPAGIGSDGITVGPSSSGDPNAVNQSLNQAVNAAGVTIKLIGATQSQDSQGLMHADASGIEVDFARPVSFQGTPLASLGLTDTYTAQLLFGFASTLDLARNIPSGSTGGSSSIGGTSAGSSVGSSTPAGSSKGSIVGTPQTVPPTTAGGADTTAGNPVQSAGFLGIDPGRIKFLYLAFTLAALGCCLSPRLTLPARLPGPLH